MKLVEERHGDADRVHNDRDHCEQLEGCVHTSVAVDTVLVHVPLFAVIQFVAHNPKGGAR